MGVTTPRPTRSSTRLVAPAGTGPDHAASLMSLSLRTVPSSRSRPASAICTVALGAADAGRLTRTRYSTRLAPKATINAKVKTPTNLLLILFPVSPTADLTGVGCRDVIFRGRFLCGSGRNAPSDGNLCPLLSPPWLTRYYKIDIGRDISAMDAWHAG